MQGRTHDDWQVAGSRLADAGYAVIAIDFRSGDAPAALLELDIKAAKAFLHERPDVIARRDRALPALRWAPIWRSSTRLTTRW